MELTWRQVTLFGSGFFLILNQAERFIGRIKFGLMVASVVGSSLIADVASDDESYQSTPLPDTFKTPDAVLNLQKCGFESKRIFLGCMALSKMPRSESAYWGEAGPVAIVLYWMHGAEETREAAIIIAESINKGELIVGGYLPPHRPYFPQADSSAIVATKFVESKVMKGKILGAIMYYKARELESLPYEQRAQVIIDEFNRITIIRSVILQKEANGMSLQEAIDSSSDLIYQGNQGN